MHGEIGDASTVNAIDDVLRVQAFDEVIVANPPVTLWERLVGGFAPRLRPLTNALVTPMTVANTRPL